MKYLEMRTVIAKFEGTEKEYSYFVPDGDKPKCGDYIVTSTSWSQEFYEGDDPSGRVRKSLSTANIARIIKIEATPSERATKFYVQLLSVDALVARKAENDKLVETIEARKEAKRKLDVMLSERDKVAEYRRLAASDPEAASLLEILEG